MKQENMMAILAAKKDGNKALKEATKQVSDKANVSFDLDELKDLEMMLSGMVKKFETEDTPKSIYYGESGVWNAKINRRGLAVPAHIFFYK